MKSKALPMPAKPVIIMFLLASVTAVLACSFLELILENYSNFDKIRDIKPRIGKLANVM